MVFNNLTGDGKDVIFLSCNFMNSIQESYCDGEEKGKEREPCGRVNII